MAAGTFRGTGLICLDDATRDLVRIMTICGSCRLLLICYLDVRHEGRATLLIQFGVGRIVSKILTLVAREPGRQVLEHRDFIVDVINTLT